ncbi:hypothetical protein C7D74_32065, partial [Klebsiella pneumoniae]
DIDNTSKVKVFILYVTGRILMVGSKYPIPAIKKNNKRRKNSIRRIIASSRVILALNFFSCGNSSMLLSKQRSFQEVAE